MSLNIIDFFIPPCTARIPQSPCNVPISPLNSLLDASKVMSYWGANGEIAHHIERNLENSAEFKNWLKKMPGKTPVALSNYQRLYSGGNINLNIVNSEIITHGALLPHGQVLFHGGHWKNFSSNLKTTRPLATTFCPQVAMREAEHRAKSYDNDYIDLIMFRLDHPTTKAFIFKHKGTAMGHEKEVLFATGAKITIIKRTPMNNQYPAGKYGHPEKRIQSFLVEATIS
ncbi:TPA: hypothetical protein ACNFOV_003167 [Enterobacter kobei]